MRSGLSLAAALVGVRGLGRSPERKEPTSGVRERWVYLVLPRNSLGAP